MKSSKGITLISLITYIVGMVIAVAIISTITTYFSKNVSLSDLKNTEIEYSKFSSVFTKEIHIKNNKVIECYTQGEGKKKISYIIFSTGNQYTYMAQDKSIFKNKIKICENVEDCEFNYNNLKHEITVSFKTNSTDLTGENKIKYYINVNNNNYNEETENNVLYENNQNVLEENTL